MNFDLSEDQQAFEDAARAFAHKELAPKAACWDKEKYFPKDVIRKAGELGFCGLYCPEEYGGMNLSRLDSSIILEQLASGCTSTAAYISIHNMAVWMLCSYGKPEVVERFAPDLISGKRLASYCLTEAGAGSDAASLRTSATLKGDGYLLNGSKMFISGAGETDVLIVMARTGEEGKNGISAFAVRADAEGISYGANLEKLGWNNQPTREITFQNVLVPTVNRLAEEGDGFKIAMKGLNGGRVNIAACSIGTAQAALRRSRDYLLERVQFGKKLADFQALQFKLADMATELTAAKQLVRMAAFKLDNMHVESTTYVAMAKRFATDVAFEVCNAAMQLHGAYGYMKEYPLERYLRDTRAHQILEGTNEIMRMITARRLLSMDASELI